MTDYKKLKVWAAGLELFEAIYHLTAKYPRQEAFNLTSQTNRAASSILANIAEGLGRGHNNDSVRFLLIARGSGYEVEAHLCMAEKINLITGEELMKVEEIITRILKMINGLIRYVEKNHQ